MVWITLKCDTEFVFFPGVEVVSVLKCPHVNSQRNADAIIFCGVYSCNVFNLMLWYKITNPMWHGVCVELLVFKKKKGHRVIFGICSPCTCIDEDIWTYLSAFQGIKKTSENRMASYVNSDIICLVNHAQTRFIKYSAQTLWITVLAGFPEFAAYWNPIIKCNNVTALILLPQAEELQVDFIPTSPHCAPVQQVFFYASLWVGYK